MFNVQCSMFNVQCSMFNVQCSPSTITSTGQRLSPHVTPLCLLAVCLCQGTCPPQLLNRNGFVCSMFNVQCSMITSYQPEIANAFVSVSSGVNSAATVSPTRDSAQKVAVLNPPNLLTVLLLKRRS